MWEALGSGHLEGGNRRTRETITVAQARWTHQSLWESPNHEHARNSEWGAQERYLGPALSGEQLNCYDCYPYGVTAQCLC